MERDFQIYLLNMNQFTDNLSLITVRKDGVNFKPYYSFVALSSKKLSANKRTDGRKLQNMYMICFHFIGYKSRKRSMTKPTMSSFHS